MKTKLMLLFLVSLVWLSPAPGVLAAESEVRDGVFIHVSSGPENPHKVLMALNMASIMAESKDVLMYFDIKGIEVVLKDAQSIEYAQFPNSNEAIRSLVEKGVPLYACPGCLKAAGKSPDDLAEGIQVADKDAFFDFTEGRILSLDY